MGGGAGGGSGVSVAAGALLTAELCAPLLLLCGLCCWPLDDRDDTCSTGKGKHPQKPVVARASSGRRSSEVFSHRAASSAASLHLPSTSGHSKQSLAAHRSHEEIRSRRPSRLEVGGGVDGGDGAAGGEGRYHSAPSVIDEVLHRRDWERSSRELYIPLRPDAELYIPLRPEADLSDADSDFSSPPAPHAEPESSSIECIHKEEKVSCKKHYTNIKSSRNRTPKERNQDDFKDTDATESEAHGSSFYIGDTNETSFVNKEDNDVKDAAAKVKSVYKAKDAKQYFNESIKTKERPHVPSGFDDPGPSLEGYRIRAVDIDLDLYADDLDRSGAAQREPHDASPGSLTTVVSRGSRAEVFPPPSVEAVGWDGGACYLQEGGRGLGRLAAGGGRGRHASDGDILAPAHRPESGAFSESDLELELESATERPPRYEDLQPPTTTTTTTGRKETAI